MPRIGLAKHPTYKMVYRITMQTKSGKMYLEVCECWYSKKKKDYVRNYGWTFKKCNAMQFDTKEEAEEFSNGYFKNFTRWFIDEEEMYDGAW